MNTIEVLDELLRKLPRVSNEQYMYAIQDVEELIYNLKDKLEGNDEEDEEDEEDED